jgi:flagellar motor switch protein FliG
VSDTDNYVRAVLKRALGDDKAALLIDRILQGGDVSGIESLKWMDPIVGGRTAAQRTPADLAAILVHLDSGPFGQHPQEVHRAHSATR